MTFYVADKYITDPSNFKILGTFTPTATSIATTVNYFPCSMIYDSKDHKQMHVLFAYGLGTYVSPVTLVSKTKKHKMRKKS